MRVYDIIIYLFLFAILTVMFSKLFDLLNIAISQIDIIDMQNVTHYITIISNGLYQLTSVSYTHLTLPTIYSV